MCSAGCQVSSVEYEVSMVEGHSGVLEMLEGGVKCAMSSVKFVEC